MDHLHNGHSETDIRVPYLCNVMYDGGDFDGYPSRADYQIPAIAAGVFQNKTRGECVGFLQSWMYFGLLWDFFHTIEGFNLWDFVTNVDNSIQIITTEKLPRYIRSWNSLEQAKSAEERNGAFERTRYRLWSLHNLAVFFCEGVPAGDDRVRTVLLLPIEVSLSIQVLADTLQHAGHVIYRGNYNIEWGFSSLLKLRMSQAGWCPRAIATCTRGQQIHNLSYASTLGQPAQRRDHTTCDEHVCRWEQVDVATYVTQHRPDCPQTCSEEGPGTTGLIGTYQLSRTPLIHLDPKNNIIDLSDSMASPSYVAISHVWGDGLGNQNGNSLPLCQLRFIQNLVDKLQEDAGVVKSRNYWWCDTLCVPVDPAFDEYRKLAIRDMRHTYANATCVLALDAEMMNVSISVSPVEMYVRLKLSGWARRLWTLQEAKLASNVVIQFADGIRSLSQIFDAVHTDGRQDERNLYTRYSFLANNFFQPFLQQQTGAPVPARMINMWKQLQWRGTSRQADEAVCLSTIMGLDPLPILAIPSDNPDERMARFLRLAETIPFVLLIQPPPRLGLAGFRWAPSSLLNCFRDNVTNPYRIVPGVGKVEPNGRGLQLERPGVMLRLEDADSPSRFEWTGEVFSLSVGKLSGEADIYKLLFLFSQDQAQLGIFGTKRSGKPVIIFLEAEGLPLGTKGMCILGEVVDALHDDESTGTNGRVKVEFVTIVTMLPSASSQGKLYPAGPVSKQNWLLV